MKKVMLIADDVKMSRSVISRFFAESFDILEAEDGKQTLEVLKNNKVDVLILDIIMPEIDGIEVLKEVRSSRKYDNMAILVATSTKEKTERLALQYGADDVVAKPYDPIVIHKRLDNILACKAVQKGVNGSLSAAEVVDLANRLSAISDILSDEENKSAAVHLCVEKIKGEAKHLYAVADGEDDNA